MPSRGDAGSLTAPQLPPVCPAGAAVIAHVRASGGWVHPSLMVSERGSGMGRSIHVTSSVPAGEPLAYVPLSACLTSQGTGPGAASELARLFVTPGAVHESHMSVLPRLDAALSPFPMLWTDTVVESLGHPQLEATIRAERAQRASQHDADACDLSTWLWACSMVDSRAYKRWDGRLSVEPLVDLVNHAPFTRPGSTQRRRNCLHSYVQPGTADIKQLRHFDPALSSTGAAVLLTIRPLSAGDEVLVSYRDMEVGGEISAADSLLRYGFVRDDFYLWRSHELTPEDVVMAQQILARHVDEAVAVGTPKDALLQAALALHARQVTRETCDLLLQAERHRLAWTPIRMALLYRCGRVHAMGRAALSRLPQDALTGGGLVAGIRASKCPWELRDVVLVSLTEQQDRLLTMDEDYAIR